MVRGGEGIRRGPRIDRLGGIVLAMVVGALVPPLVVSVMANRDPLPRSCSSGQVSGTRLDGAILRSTTGADLWYSEGNPGQPRKLVDYAPAPPRGTPGATPGAGSPGSAAPAASPSGTPASPIARVPTVVAADISADRRLVALVVVDPADRPGFISLRLMSPLDPPGKAPVEAWYTEADRHPLVPPAVNVLDNNRVLVVAGVPRTALTPPSPAVSPLPSPSARPASSPSAASVGSPSPLVSAGAGPSPGGSASPSPSPSLEAAVVVVVDGGTGKVADVAPLDIFESVAHSQWPDTKSYRLPSSRPVVPRRVEGPLTSVAGAVPREVGTPLANRHLSELVVGTAGKQQTRIVCSLAAGFSPLAFSPDEAGLALFDGTRTWYLDLGGNHAVTRFVEGRVMAWRA